MNLKIALTIASFYMLLVGIGHIFAPIAMSAGIIPDNASTEMVSFIRHYSALFLSLAVLNWFARNADPSVALTAVVYANLVAFTVAGILDIFTVLSNGNLAGLMPITLNFLIAILIFWTSRKNT
jgi:hypothetical protein